MTQGSRHPAPSGPPTPPGGARGRRRLRAPRRLLTWRDALRSRPLTARLYRGAVALVGWGIIVTGIVLLPLPGPGWVIIFLGLEILASEFTWAARLRTFTHTWLRRWTHWVTGRSRRARQGMGLGVVLALLLAGYLAVYWTGLPGFAPDLMDSVPGWTRTQG